MIMKPFFLKSKVFGWVDHPASRANTFSLQASYTKPWWDFALWSLQGKGICCYPFLNPTEKSKINKRKKENLKKYKRIHMKRAYKTVQVGGEGQKWQVKSWKTKIYKIEKLATKFWLNKIPY